MSPIRTLTILVTFVALIGMLFPLASIAAGGPLGIDHEITYDNSGIWKRSTQLALIDTLVVGELSCGLWEGEETLLGKTCWQAIDSSLFTAATTSVMKLAFSRARPSQGNNSDAWFQGKSHQSFPSGEVAGVSAVVTPFILEYSDQHPEIWVLEVLPLYDGIARMKVQAHWQTDVLVGFAIGSLVGYYAHNRDSPLTLSILPHSVSVGWKNAW